MAQIHSTRVRAPATGNADGVQALHHRAPMTPGAQSSPGDGIRLTADAKAAPRVDLRSTIRIATWNVLTMAHPGFPEAIQRELARYKIGIIGLTETRVTGHGESKVNDSTLLHSGGTDHSKGVALMLSKQVSHSITSWQPVSDRILRARLAHVHGHITVIVVYAPTEDAAAPDKDAFYNQLEPIVRSTPPHDELIILGDLNAVSGTDRFGFEQVVGPFGSGTANDNTHRLLTMCAATNLSIMGSWFQRRETHRLSWISNDGRTRKELDHIICRNRSMIISCRVFRGAEPPANSDHRLVAARVRLQPKRVTRAKVTTRLDVEALSRDYATASRYSIAISNAFQALGALPDDVEEAWVSVRSTITDVAADTVGAKRPQRKPWISAETLSIIDEKRHARLRGDVAEHRRLRGVFKARSKADLETFYSQLAEEVEHGVARNNLRPAYKAIRRLRSGTSTASDVPIVKADGSPCASQDEVLARWHEHYNQMLNHESADDCPELDVEAANATPDESIAVDIPDIDEVRQAIRKLRNGRASGPDNIPPELLKCAEEPISKALHAIIAKVWSSGKVPAEWRDGIIVSLYKGKGPKSSCSSYRPITLLSVPGKVFAHVLLARIQPLLSRTRRPQQSGFTKGRSTMDAVLALRLLAELHREFNRPLNVAYIDIKAAFDSVDRAALWKSLKAIGLPPVLLQLLQDLHAGTTSRVRVGSHLSAPFATTSGVRQGCILAPALFLRAIDWIMSLCSARLGKRVGAETFTDLDYADDAVLLNEDPSDWPVDLAHFDTAAHTMGLHTSWAKTKVQNISCGQPARPVTVAGQTVEATNRFTYLGCDIDSDGHSSTDIRRRIGIASSVMGQLDRVWKQPRLRLATKFRIYNACVVSVLLYGSETWTVLKADAARLQSFHMNCQRRILGVRWYDHVTNAAVTMRARQPNIVDAVIKRRHSLFGHVRRLPTSVPAHAALRLCVDVRRGARPAADWRRPRGRPRYTWVRQLEADHKASIQELWDTAADRVTWRTQRPAAGYAD